jgi:hypothetical protein
LIGFRLADAGTAAAVVFLVQRVPKVDSAIAQRTTLYIGLGWFFILFSILINIFR